MALIGKCERGLLYLQGSEMITRGHLGLAYLVTGRSASRGRHDAEHA